MQFRSSAAVQDLLQKVPLQFKFASQRDNHVVLRSARSLYYPSQRGDALAEIEDAVSVVKVNCSLILTTVAHEPR